MEFEGLLVDLGCVVVGPFGRVERALAASRTESLDGAVLDVNLGGDHSFPVAEQLVMRSIPFFFVTGLVISAFPASLRHAPVLAKPVEPKAFGELVRRLVVKAA